MQPSKESNLPEAMVYIKTLTERVDKHSLEMKEGFERIYDGLNEIRSQQMKDSSEIRRELESIRIKAAEDRLETFKQINAVKDLASADNHRLSLKIAFIMGAIGLATGGVGSFIERKFMPEDPNPKRTIIRYETSVPPESIP